VWKLQRDIFSDLFIINNKLDYAEFYRLESIKKTEPKLADNLRSATNVYVSFLEKALIKYNSVVVKNIKTMIKTRAEQEAVLGNNTASFDNKDLMFWLVGEFDKNQIKTYIKIMKKFADEEGLTFIDGEDIYIFTW
jgi:hypothetical protein